MEDSCKKSCHCAPILGECIKGMSHMMSYIWRIMGRISSSKYPDVEDKPFMKGFSESTVNILVSFSLRNIKTARLARFSG